MSDTQPNVDGLETLVQELIDWNYGTVYKGYDTEELCEVLEEDTRERVAIIVRQAKKDLLAEVREKAGWYSQQFSDKARADGTEDTLIPLSAIKEIEEGL